MTNYKHIMSQTKNKKSDESEPSDKQLWIIKNRQVFLADHILLICNGADLVFAWGDPNVFDCKVDQLQHRNLFELGFTRYSLQILKRQMKGGLLQNNCRLKYPLQYVKPDITRSHSEQDFNKHKSHYLKKMVLKCSLMLSRFGREPVQPGQCKVKRQPVPLFNLKQSQQIFALVQIYVEGRQFQFETTFQDYLCTYEKMPGSQKVLKKIYK